MGRVEREVEKAMGVRRIGCIFQIKGGNMPIKNTFARSFKQTKHPKTTTGSITSKAISLIGRIKDPTGIAGSWSDSRSAEEIIASIRDSRKSKR